MDRKAIIREYKESRRPMGVFQVRNTVTSQVFIGASTDLPAMLNRQRAQLRLGAHVNRRLQADCRRTDRTRSCSRCSIPWKRSRARP